MAVELGDVLDLLRTLTEWPSGSGRQGPARQRVGRWMARIVVAIVLLTAIAALMVWLRSQDFAAFDRDGLPVVVLGLVALIATMLIYFVAAIVANAIDRKARKQ